MSAITLLIFLLNYSHLICAFVVFVIMFFVLRKKVYKKDPDWLYNHIWHIITTSSFVGGFITLVIGFAFFIINGKWPSDYIPPNTVYTSLFMISIYILVLVAHRVKKSIKTIEESYAAPRVK